MQQNINTLSNSFEKTLKDTNLQGIGIELGEVIIDGVLKDGTLKDIPIIGTIIGIGKTANNIKDTLFLRKILHFISEIQKIDTKERNGMILEIENSKKFRIKVGEKLLYIIDKCEDHINAEYIAKMFNAFIRKKITYSEFLRSSIIIQNILITDLEEFISKEYYYFERSYDNHWGEYIGDFESSLINVGLCVTSTQKIELEKEDGWNDDELVVKGGNIEIKVTDIGKKINEVLKN
jgi:hypothetical protein